MPKNKTKYKDRIHGKDVRRSFTQRLVEATKVCDKMVEPTLKKRKKMLDVWTAGYYNSEVTEPRTINLTDRGIGILAPYLVMSDPRAMIGTKHTQLRPYANTAELALNFHNEQTRLGSRTLRPAVINSLIGMGIVRTGIMHLYDTYVNDAPQAIGEIYSDVVDDSQYVFDPSAKNRASFEFEGNHYEMPTADAKEFFGSKHADSIQSTRKLWGDNDPRKLVKPDVGKAQYRLKEFTQFTDYYLPDENVIITIDPYTGNPKILRTVEWDGPDEGPYDVLGYKYPPGTPIPMPPVWGWLDMEDVINTIVNKMKNQANQERNVLAYQAGAEDDAKRVAETADRGTCRVDNIQGMQIFNFPGINSDSYQWLSYIEQQYSAQGHNLYTLGGQRSDAGTLGQEQMQFANASKAVDDMADAVYAFARNIMKKRFWYLFTDPLIQIPVVKRVAPTINIPEVFDAATREGNFLEYTFNIVPYSMQRMSPDQEYRRLLTYLSQIAIPLAGPAAQQGKQLNVSNITDMMGRYANLQDFGSIWTDATKQDDMSSNPYTPRQAVPQKTKQGGIMNGQLGADKASRDMNSIQKTTRDGSAN